MQIKKLSALTHLNNCIRYCSYKGAGKGKGVTMREMPQAELNLCHP